MQEINLRSANFDGITCLLPHLLSFSFPLLPFIMPRRCPADCSRFEKKLTKRIHGARGEQHMAENCLHVFPFFSRHTPMLTYWDSSHRLINTHNFSGSIYCSLHIHMQCSNFSHTYIRIRSLAWISFCKAVCTFKSSWHFVTFLICTNPYTGLSE